jgi:hypothetical protein
MNLAADLLELRVISSADILFVLSSRILILIAGLSMPIPRGARARRSRALCRGPAAGGLCSSATSLDRLVRLLLGDLPQLLQRFLFELVVGIGHGHSFQN